MEKYSFIIISITHFLLHVLTIKQAIENFWLLRHVIKQSGSDVTRYADSTEKMDKMLILD